MAEKAIIGREEIRGGKIMEQEEVKQGFQYNQKWLEKCREDIINRTKIYNEIVKNNKAKMKDRKLKKGIVGRK